MCIIVNIIVYNVYIVYIIAYIIAYTIYIVYIIVYIIVYTIYIVYSTCIVCMLLLPLSRFSGVRLCATP